MATLFVDYENGNNNFAGTSFNVLASGTNGRITTNTFSSSTGSFPNDGTICNINNILGASERLYDIGHWTTNNTTITTVDIAPPSGLVANVHSFIETTSNSQHTLYNAALQYSTTTSAQYTISLYAKAIGRNILSVRFNISADSTSTIRYNLSSGTIAESGSGASGTITSVGDGWYRLTLTANAASTNQRITIGLANDSHTGLEMQTYTGNGLSGVYLSGLQLQAGGSATTYEKSPQQYLSIFNGSIYAVYEIIQYLSATSLFIARITSGTNLANQTVDRQYYIGGRWQTLTNGASSVRLIEGDTIRIMGSPQETLLDNATWTGQKTPAQITISSSTNASPISITCSSTMSSLGLSTGDTVQIIGHTINTNANGTWEITVPSSSGTSFTLNGSTGNGIGGASGVIRKKTNSVVRLASSATANIASYGNRGNGRTSWTAATGDIAATLLDSDTKEGDVSDSIAIGTAFTTGKTAYKATGTLDLSGYQQISFWIKQTAGTVTVDNDISLILCSDTTGDTAVHTFNIEGLLYLNTWICITIDLNANMNNSIQSIGLYVNVDRGAQTFLLSNIIASKAKSSNNSLNLCSLISKNTSNEPWFPLMSINGTRVMLGATNSAIPNTTNDAQTDRGYFGTSETITTYKRETIKSLPSSTFNKSGTITNRTRYLFGWDRTNMSTQNLVTYLDGRSGGGGIYGVSNSAGANYIDIDRVGAVRYHIGVVNHGLYNILSLESIVGCVYGISHYIGGKAIVNKGIMACNGTYPVNFDNTNFHTFNNIVVVSNIGHGIFINTASNIKLNNIISANNLYRGVSVNNADNISINSGIINSNNEVGLAIYGPRSTMVKNVTFSNNTNRAIILASNSNIFLENCVINESTEVTINSYTDGRAHFKNHDNTIGNNFTAADGGIITPQTAIRYSNSGYAWALSPLSTIKNSNYPLDLKIATFVVNANGLVIVKVWMRRNSIFLTAGLRIKGGQIAGVPNDLTSYMSAAANVWEELILTFTPSEIGVVEILAECYGGTTYTAYVDDISITQI